MAMCAGRIRPPRSGALRGAGSFDDSLTIRPMPASTFDLTDGMNVLRIACGAFFIPHAVGKLREREFSLGFFVKAGFPRPLAWLYAALAIEALAAAGLILGVYPRYAALLAAVFLVVAALACYRVSGKRWYWNFGGAEFCVFWAIACVVVAIRG